jgi:NAD(P)-dependent dehydrogenase (short-subunit alcohol dehydrogenase family)
MSGVLAGRIGFVTGGASGIGLATAERFAAEGVHVDRREAIVDGDLQELVAAVVGHSFPPDLFRTARA